MRPRAIVSAFVVAIGCGAMTFANAQEQSGPVKYVPVLPAVKARALPVDPAKGYAVKQIAPSVFVITDGVYQSAFVTTGQGVILIDAPESFAGHIPRAVAEATKEPIRQLIYSHTLALFRTLLDGVINTCNDEIEARWIDKLAGVDIWASSHCRAALIYARWDD